MFARPLRADQSFLVVIDIQANLLGAMAADDAARVVRNATILVEGGRALGIPALATEQYPRGLGPTEATLRAALETIGSSVVEKLEFDATENDSARAQFHRFAADGRRLAIVAGMETHICVAQTARGLRALGFDVAVALDATSSRARSNFETGTRLLTPNALISSTEAILFDLLGRAGSEAFKTISKLVR